MRKFIKEEVEEVAMKIEEDRTLAHIIELTKETGLLRSLKKSARRIMAAQPLSERMWAAVLSGWWNWAMKRKRKNIYLKWHPVNGLERSMQ